MLADWTFLIVLAIILLATVIRSAFGFGEALIAVPLLALVLPVEVAAPFAVLVSVTVAGIIIAQDWRKVHLRSAALLVGSTLFGIPFGLLLLWAPEVVVKAILGVFIVAFSTYSLISRTPFELKDDRFAWVFGFLAGITGGAYGMNGPPLVIYGSLRRWSPEHFRATLQGYFLPASLVGMIGYALTGLWTFEVTRYYLLSLPVVVLAIIVGRVIHGRLKDRRFLTYVHIGLILIGAVLLLQALYHAFKDDTEVDASRVSPGGAAFIHFAQTEDDVIADRRGPGRARLLPSREPVRRLIVDEDPEASGSAGASPSRFAIIA